MSKRRTKNHTSRPEVNGLLPAFPAAPTRTGAFVLYIKREGKFISAQVFAAAYAAQKFVDLLVADDDITLQTDTLIKAGMITIKCDRLAEVMDHTLTSQEEAWELPTPYPQTAERLRSGEVYEPPEPTTHDEPTAPRQSPRKERKPRVSRDDLVGIAQIAEEMSMTSREARSILRKSDLPKPEAGWAWAEGLEVDQVKAVLGKK